MEVNNAQEVSSSSPALAAQPSTMATTQSMGVDRNTNPSEESIAPLGSIQNPVDLG